MDQHPDDPHCAIYSAWEEHSLNLPPGRYRPHPDSSGAVWSSLWAQYAPCGPEELAIEDLALLCHWGWTMAMERGDCVLAISRLLPWFSRHDRFQDDGPDWAEMHACVIDSHLRSAEHGLAAEAARAALAHEQPRHRRTSALAIRNTLLRFGATQSDSAQVPAAAVAIAEAVLRALSTDHNANVGGESSPRWQHLLGALSSTPPPSARDSSA